MKKLLLTLILWNIIGTAAAQQTVAGTSYYLPKTALRFSFLIEKTTYEPGQFAAYADRYMKKKVSLTPSTTYRIINCDMQPTAVPDTTKQFTLLLDKKISIYQVEKSDEGILLAINATGKRLRQPDAFVPAKQPADLNPRDFMNEDILTANSSAKMAELIAEDIYDIRESRNQLTRGQAESMPKDGEQLKIMMSNLNTQETALNQVFEGITRRDTIEKVITYVPVKGVGKTLLFRFSKKLGITDPDDLAGVPYELTIDEQHQVTDQTPVPEESKKSKEDFGLNVNMPDKIRVVLTSEGETLKTFEVLAAQFGKTENLSAELFGKKQTSKLILNPLTGSIESIQAEVIK